MKQRSQVSTEVSSNNNDTLKDTMGIKKQNGYHPKVKEDSAEIQIVWKNVFLLGSIHVAAIYGIFLTLKEGMRWTTALSGGIFGLMSGFGTTAGAHRLWAHKAYKAKLPLRIFLAICQSVAAQNSIHEWCRDHRVHHKFTETHADPHNALRGFFFSHVGWLLCKKHDDVKNKGKQVDMSDLEQDPVVMFQKKYYVLLTTLSCFIIPTLIPWYLGESFLKAWYITLMRYVLSLNFTWLVNSAAHLWGPKPYDKTINPVENLTVAILAFGEGWHNYHHVFPWDYKAAELGAYKHNISTAFIDFMAWCGLAYDLKSVPEKIVLQRVTRTGDGTHSHAVENSSADPNAPLTFNSHATWGWDDKDVSKEDQNLTQISHKLE